MRYLSHEDAVFLWWPGLVPYSQLQHVVAEIPTMDVSVDKRLVPFGLAGLLHCFRPPFALVAAYVKRSHGFKRNPLDFPQRITLGTGCCCTCGRGGSIFWHKRSWAVRQAAEGALQPEARWRLADGQLCHTTASPVWTKLQTFSSAPSLEDIRTRSECARSPRVAPALAAEHSGASLGWKETAHLQSVGPSSGTQKNWNLLQEKKNGFAKSWFQKRKNTTKMRENLFTTLVYLE